MRIGIYSSIASGFLAELLYTYGLRHGNVRIELVDGNPEEHVAAIRQFRLDVAFLTGERDWPGCDRAQLWSERVFVVLPDRHPLACQSASKRAPRSASKRDPSGDVVSRPVAA